MAARRPLRPSPPELTSDDFPTQVLLKKRAALLVLAPATDDRQAVHQQIKELDRAIERLRLPYFEVGAFL